MSCCWSQLDDVGVLGIAEAKTPSSRAGLLMRSKNRPIDKLRCRFRPWMRSDGLAGSGAQAVDFLRGQRTEFSGRHIQRKRSVFYALDFLHVMADLFKHAADLPIASLDEGNFVPGIRSFFHDADFRRRGSHSFPLIGSDGEPSTELG